MSSRRLDWRQISISQPKIEVTEIQPERSVRVLEYLSMLLPIIEPLSESTSRVAMVQNLPFYF